MISFKSAEFLMRIVVVLVVYFVTAPLTGYFRAWTAEKMGDSTPAQLGFLTLNPIAHVSIWWIVFIIWIQTSFMHFTPIALGKYVPINPHNIQGQWRGLKLACAYLSDSFVNIVLGIISFFVLILTFKADALLFIEQAVSLRSLTLLQPGLSSFQIIVIWFMATFALFNCLVAAFSVISNLFNFVMFYYFEDLLHSSEYSEMILIFGPLLLLYTMISWVWSYVIAFVIGMAYLLAMLVGVI
ncbi:hypothetical protein EBU24_01725 [bacterium]|nr:hypothetical protein [bacterium]